MGREIAVQTEALSSLSKDYSRYGENIYGKYKTGASKIERELESILRNYSDYSSVTSKVYQLQSELKGTERQIKEVQERANKLSNGLNAAVQAYAMSENEEKRLIGKEGLDAKRLGQVSISSKVGIQLNVDMKTNEISKGSETKGSTSIFNKIGNMVNEGIEAVKNFDVKETIEGISKKAGDTFSNITKEVSAAVGQLGEDLDNFADQTKQTFINIAGTIQGKWEGFKTDCSQFLKKTQDTLVDMGKKLADGMENMTNEMATAAQKLVDNIIENKDDILDGLKKVGVFLLDGVQLVLDIVGLIPAVGEIADAINGVIYLLRGDMLSAGLSFAACIPFAGWAATGGKLLGKGAKLLDKIGDFSKIVDKVKDLSKYLDRAKDIGKTILKYGDNALSFVKKKGDDLFSLLSNNKLAEKAMEAITKLSKKAVDINSFLEKQVNKVTASLGEWWGKQCQMGIVPPNVATWINRNAVEELSEELGEKVIEETTEELAEHVGGKELENQVGEDISKGVGKPSKTISEADRIKLAKWEYVPDDDLYLRYKDVFDNRKYYNQETGSINWPKNDGFASTPIDEVLQPGTRIDRYGSDFGSFTSPEGIPYEMRAVAPGTDLRPYSIFEVVEPINVKSGTIAPWFDEVGGGIQYLLPDTVDELLEAGILRRIQ